MHDDQDSELVRKFPAQGRAKQTVDTILDATAQILASQGSRGLTTNRLAHRAGFSIGTLYQYFPNREAIILALIERQRGEVDRRIRAVADAPSDEPPDRRIRQVVHILHEAFMVHRAPEGRLIQVLLRMAAARGLPSPSDAVANAIMDIWRQSHPDARALDPSETFVLTRAIIETLRHATLEASPLLGTAAFEEAVVRLILGFLAAGTDQV